MVRRVAVWAVVTPLIAACLALGLVVTTTTPAAADPISIGTAVVIGETLAAPGEVGVGSVAAGACVASVVCAGITSAAFIAGGLYLTRDAWLPVVKGALSRAFGGSPVANEGGCPRQASAMRSEPDPYLVIVSLTEGPGAGCSTVVFNMSVPWRGVCKTPTGGYRQVSGTAGSSWQLGGKYYAKTSTPVISACLGGETVVSIWFTSAPSEYGEFGFGDAVSPDQVSQTSTVKCRRPDGGIETVTKTQVGYDDRVVVPSCWEAVPGSYPVEFAVTGGWPGAEQPLVTHTLNPTPQDEYPDCFDSGSGAYLGTCRVRVWINGQPCAIGVAICTNWANYEQDHPGATVECKWGPYTVALKSCNELKKAYRPDAKPRTITKADPKTGTLTDPEVDGPSGGVSDPWTGVCLVGCEPVVPPVVPEDPRDPGNGSGCMAEAVSFNPVKWVYVPVKCVLIWAFVPPDGTFEAAVNRVIVPLQDAVGPWSDVMSDTWESIDTGTGGCQGLGVSMPATLQDAGMPATWYPASTCTPQMASIAGWSKTISTVVLVVLAVVKAVELVQSGLGLSTHVGIARGYDWKADRIS